jgi:Domain of unknown function (DUF4167)
MRPNQNNKRMRGRNNNRKGPNPLSRSYESNGPDVKIRGTAHHIGEKYLQLARDAQSSGDPVMAESYLQHAEHYFRLIAAAQQAQQQQAFGYRPAGEIEAEDAEDDDDFVSLPDRFASPVERLSPPPQQNQPYQPQQQQQPQRANGDPGFAERERQPFSGERPQYSERRPDRNFSERPAFQDRQGQQNRDNEQRGGRGRGQRDYRPDNGQRYERHEPRGEDLNGKNNNLPAFITAPVRLQPEANPAPEEESVASVMDRPEAESESGGYHLRPRRRRRGREDFGEAGPGKDSFEE